MGRPSASTRSLSWCLLCFVFLCLRRLKRRLFLCELSSSAGSYCPSAACCALCLEEDVTEPCSSMAAFSSTDKNEELRSLLKRILPVSADATLSFLLRPPRSTFFILRFIVSLEWSESLESELEEEELSSDEEESSQ